MNAGISDVDGVIECPLTFQDGTGGASIEAVNSDHIKAMKDAWYIAGDQDTPHDIVCVRSAATVVQEMKAKYPSHALIVKCDAEGAEWKIIPQLGEMGLLSSISVLMLEYHFQDPEPLFDILRKAGFVYFHRDHSHKKNFFVGNIYAVNAANAATQPT